MVGEIPGLVFQIRDQLPGRSAPCPITQGSPPQLKALLRHLGMSLPLETVLHQLGQSSITWGNPPSPGQCSTTPGSPPPPGIVLHHSGQSCTIWGNLPPPGILFQYPGLSSTPPSVQGHSPSIQGHSSIHPGALLHHLSRHPPLAAILHYRAVPYHLEQSSTTRGTSPLPGAVPYHPGQPSTTGDTLP